MPEPISVHRIGVQMTLRCTLKCKLCCAYAPYFDPPPHYTYEELTNYAKRLFDIVDNVSIFNIAGGEPLLNECLPDFLSFLKQYRERITKRLEVVTNGTLIPKESLLEAMRDNDVFVILDDYGSDLSPKAQIVAEKLSSYGISFKLRKNNSETSYFDGWVDLSTFSSNPKNEKDATWLAQNCIQANELRCNPIIYGKIYFCPAYYQCFVRGLIPDNPNEYFDLLDDSIDLDEKKRRFIAFLNLDSFPSCAYCNGWLPNSPRFTPAEEQLP